MLILETPLQNPKGDRADILYIIDVVVSSLFAIELILKVIVFGFMFNGEDSYIRNPWNIMDFIIVAFSVVTLTMKDANLGAVKSLRMLRVLRPLRMISRNPGLKIAVNSLLNAIPFIGDVIVVSLLFLLLFAILCINLYKGKFWTCHVSDDVLGKLSPHAAENLQKNINEHVEHRFQCLDYGGEWINADSNFDWILDSIITLFSVMTTEGWIDVMWSALDATEIDYAPIMIPGAYGFSVIFFMFIIFFFHLFILNMFVGIVINQFSNEKETLEMNHLLT